MKIEQKEQFCDLMAQLIPDVKITETGTVHNVLHLSFGGDIILGTHFEKLQNLVRALGLTYMIQASMREGLYIAVI